MTDHHPNQLTTAAEINRFMFAGNATMTLVSVRTGTRFTYKVSASEDGRVHFVNILTGLDNEDSFRYLGHFRAGAYTHGRKSKIGPDAPGAKAFQWFASNYDLAGALDLVEVWHEGRCGRCGRKLTVPESIATGIGPECADKLGIEQVTIHREPKPKAASKRPVKPARAALRAAEAAQSPTGKSAVEEGSEGVPFPNDSDWVQQWAAGAIAL